MPYRRQWWEWETDEDARRRQADYFKDHADDDMDTWRYQRAALSIPPVGRPAQLFFDLTTKPQEEEWKQAVIGPDEPPYPEIGPEQWEGFAAIPPQKRSYKEKPRGQFGFGTAEMYTAPEEPAPPSPEWRARPPLPPLPEPEWREAPSARREREAPIEAGRVAAPAGRAYPRGIYSMGYTPEPLPQEKEDEKPPWDWKSLVIGVGLVGKKLEEVPRQFLETIIGLPGFQEKLVANKGDIGKTYAQAREEHEASVEERNRAVVEGLLYPKGRFGLDPFIQPTLDYPGLQAMGMPGTWAGTKAAVGRALRGAEEMGPYRRELGFAAGRRPPVRPTEPAGPQPGDTLVLINGKDIPFVAGVGQEPSLPIAAHFPAGTDPAAVKFAGRKALQDNISSLEEQIIKAGDEISGKLDSIDDPVVANLYTNKLIGLQNSLVKELPALRRQANNDYYPFMADSIVVDMASDVKTPFWSVPPTEVTKRVENKLNSVWGDALRESKAGGKSAAATAEAMSAAGKPVLDLPAIIRRVEGFHQDAVVDAIKAGKDVPPETIKHYGLSKAKKSAKTINEGTPPTKSKVLATDEDVRGWWNDNQQDRMMVLGKLGAAPSHKASRFEELFPALQKRIFAYMKGRDAAGRKVTGPSPSDIIPPTIRSQNDLDAAISEMLSQNADAESILAAMKQREVPFSDNVIKETIDRLTKGKRGAPGKPPAGAPPGKPPGKPPTGKGGKAEPPDEGKLPDEEAYREHMREQEYRAYVEEPQKVRERIPGILPEEAPVELRRTAEYARYLDEIEKRPNTADQLDALSGEVPVDPEYDRYLRELAEAEGTQPPTGKIPSVEATSFPSPEYKEAMRAREYAEAAGRPTAPSPADRSKGGLSMGRLSLGDEGLPYYTTRTEPRPLTPEEMRRLSSEGIDELTPEEAAKVRSHVINVLNEKGRPPSDPQSAARAYLRYTDELRSKGVSNDAIMDEAEKVIAEARGGEPPKRTFPGGPSAGPGGATQTQGQYSRRGRQRTHIREVSGEGDNTPKTMKFDGGGQIEALFTPREIKTIHTIMGSTNQGELLEKFIKDNLDDREFVERFRKWSTGSTKKGAVVSDKMDLQDARAMMQDEQQLNKLLTFVTKSGPRTPFLSTEQKVIKGMLDTMLVRLFEMADQGGIRPSTGENLLWNAEYLQTLKTIKELFPRLKGSISEHGRALRESRILSEVIVDLKNTPAGRVMKAMNRAWKKLGKDEEYFKEVQTTMLALASEGKWTELYRLMDQLDKLDTMQKVQKFYISNLLSNPGTAILNFVATTNLALVQEVGVRPLATILARRDIREVGAAWRGEKGLFTAASLKEGIRNFAHVMAWGFSPEQVKHLDFGKHGEFEWAPFRLLNYTTRILAATDIMLRLMVYNADRQARAFRVAIKSGKTGTPQFEAAFKVAMEDEDLMEEAMKYAKVHTLTDDPSGLAKYMLELRKQGVPLGKEGIHGKFQPLYFAMPFINIINQIAIKGLEFSPAGFGMIAGKYALKKAKLAYIDETLGSANTAAQAIIGSGILMFGTSLYAEGRLTGAPPVEAGRREQQYLLERPPFSVKIGDKWIDYRPFYPVLMPLMMAAAFGDIRSDPYKEYTDKQIEDKALAMSHMVGRSVLDMPFMQSMAQFMDATVDPSYMERFVASMTGGFVPGSSLARRTERLTSPVLKKPEGLVEKLQSSLPVVSAGVPSRLTPYGEEIPREELTKGGLPSKLLAFAPLTTSIEDKDTKSYRVTKELASLGIAPAFVSKMITLPDSPLTPFGRQGPTELTREQQRDYQKVAGGIMLNSLFDLFTSPAYQKLSAKQKGERADRTISRAREEARRQLFEPTPPIIAVRESLAQKTYKKGWSELGPEEQLLLAIDDKYIEAAAKSKGQASYPRALVSGTETGENIQLRLPPRIQDALAKAGVGVGVVDRTVRYGDHPYRLDDTLYAKYQQLVEMETSNLLKGIIEWDGYRKTSPSEQQYILKRAISSAKSSARGLILAEAALSKGIPRVTGRR